MRAPLVLIVDDEPDVLLMMRTGLEAYGYRTALAGDGDTAIQRIKEQKPDVVLLDLMMPMVDGWAVLELLAQRPRQPGVIIVSAKTRPEDVTKAFRMGADAYITKPFSFDLLFSTIGEVAERSDSEREEHRARMIEELETREPSPDI